MQFPDGGLIPNSETVGVAPLREPEEACFIRALLNDMPGNFAARDDREREELRLLRARRHLPPLSLATAVPASPAAR